MNKIKFVAGILVFVSVFGMTVIGCDNDTTKKTFAPELIGKWELESILVNGTTHSLPWNGINSIGYEFASNVFTQYAFTQYGGGEPQSSIGYTENNIIYIYGQAIYSYSVSGNKLTLTNIIDGFDDNSVGIASKVTKFSWE